MADYEAIVAFHKAIEASGLTPPRDIVPDGKIHRFASNCDARDDAGWYVFYPDGSVPAGAFGCWRTGIKQTWHAKPDRILTAAESQALQDRIADANRQRDEAERVRHEQAAERAIAEWEQATKAPANHPYLQRKGIRPHTLRVVADGRLVVPLRKGGKIRSLQFISADGEKRFLRDGEVKGCYFAVGKSGGISIHSTLVIAEGAATAISIYEATGMTVVAALSAGNLLPVAQAMRAKYAALTLIFAADDDFKTGLSKAREAAAAVNGFVAVPEFGQDRPEGAKDFNDLARHKGADAVKQCILWPLNTPPDESREAHAEIPEPAHTVADEPPKAEAPPKNSGQWKDLLRKDKSGNFYADVNNVMSALMNAPELVGLLRYNEFADVVELAHSPPWRSDEVPCAWTDEHRVHLQAWLQGERLRINRDTVVQDAAVTIAKTASYHPVRDYIMGLIWDGTARIDDWLTTYLGAAGNLKYLRAVGSRFLIAAVARVMQPGCKADCMLVFESPQGFGKSSAALILAGQRWFSDSLPDLHSKDAAIQLQGRWIQELSELAAMRKSDVETAKAFVSRTHDIYRPPYGRNTVERARQCVFIATTNDKEYLPDETGARRFWPVRCREIDMAALKSDRDQLWAEAAARFARDEAWHLSQELEVLAETEQALRRLVPEHEEQLISYLDELLQTEAREVTMHDLLRHVGQIQDFTKQYGEAGALAKMFSRVLAREGWEKLAPIGRGKNRRQSYRHITSKARAEPS